MEEEVAAPLRVWEQPGPEHFPPDHAATCAAAGTSAEGWRRADLAFEFIDARAITVDVRTVNCLARSAVGGRSSARDHMASLEADKRARYSKYYDEFRPFVISLTGAVTEYSFGTIKQIARVAADSYGSRLDWEPYRWAVLALRRVQVAVVRTVTAALVRAPWGVRAAERLVAPGMPARPPGAVPG